MEVSNNEVKDGQILQNFASKLNIEELPFNSSLTKNDEILSMTDNKNFHENIKNAEFRLMKIKDDNFVLEKNNIWRYF